MKEAKRAGNEQEIPPSHVRVIDTFAIQRDALQGLLETDLGASSEWAEGIATNMMEQLKAGQEVDTSAYGPEVALFVHDEQQRIKDIRESHAKSKAERAARKAAEAAEAAIGAEEQREEISEYKPGHRREDVGIFSLDEINKAVAAAEERKKRQAIVAESTMIVTKPAPKKSRLREWLGRLAGNP